MPKFRKKPVEIEAVQWTCDNRHIVSVFCADARFEGESAIIETLEGDMTASRGDWIIRGVKGEFYPCKPDIFEQTYDPA